MKKLLLALTVVALLATPCLAKNIEALDEVRVGVKVDLPNLIKLTENSSVGVEGSMDDLHDRLKDGSQIYVKYTWRGDLLDFSK